VPNLVKDYLWPDHVDNKMVFQFSITIAIFLITMVAYPLMYIPGYLGWDIYKKYEIEPEQKKPWEKENWEYMKKRTFWNVMANELIVNTVYMGLGLYLAGSRMKFEGFPTHYEIVRWFAIALIADDFIYMIVHRLFHDIPFLYKFHKVHHEYESVFCFISQYAHPVEHVLGNWVAHS
jgi:sterol desaturase/sphingolipid hydroxylase (fatty acid hydroxylase superfamily)